MQIKINKKKYNIKPASELSINEYIDYLELIEQDNGGYSQIVNYIKVVTGVELGDLLNIQIDDKSIRRLTNYIGAIIHPEEMQVKKSFYYGRFGRTLHQDPLMWRTLGARKLLEQKEGLNRYQQAVYLLSVYIQKNYDAAKIEMIYQDLQNYRALDVFGFIIFFLKSSSNGKLKGKV